jgi:hypothetical protein
MSFPDLHDTLDLYLSSDSLIRVFRGEAGPPPERMRWLHGPGLAAVLREQHSDLEVQLGKNLMRTVKSWKAGVPASEAVADKVLVRLGGTLVDLPGDLWIDRPKRRPRRKLEATEELAIEDIGPRTRAALDGRVAA